MYGVLFRLHMLHARCGTVPVTVDRTAVFLGSSGKPDEPLFARGIRLPA
ncbi:MAG: hypothetical protein FWG01_00775 [Betaproteobacteria bacterium]|nr:hypothetical protein [Betaproteobacteria bacterium]